MQDLEEHLDIGIKTSMQTWQNYYKDANKVEVLIKYSFNLPSRVNNFNIDKHPLHIRQTDGEMSVNFHKEITLSLYNDIKKFFECFNNKLPIPEDLLRKNPSQYIVGFIEETMRLVNEEILARKYDEGHILLKTISIFEINNVFIVDASGNYYPILWPKTIPGWPEINKVSNHHDVVFIRDMMDAMTEYFNYNFDECVRKIITSIENYFVYYKLRTTSKKSFLQNIIYFRKTRLEKQINEYISEKYYKYLDRDLKILRDNIITIYRIRNLVVHDKLRLKLNNSIFCKKGIDTLLHIYQSNFIRDDKRYDYILALYGQFFMISEMLIGLNLDNFAKADKKKISWQGGVFDGLKITKQEKQKVRR